MTFDDLPFSLTPEQRGFNRLLAEYVDVPIEMVQGWKRRKKIPEAYQRLIAYKMRVQELAKEISER